MKLAAICLSDLHLGEEDSLLTNIERHGQDWKVDPVQSSPVMAGMLDVFARLKKQVNQDQPMGTLVLAGDVFELALGRYREALAVFKLFLKSLMEKELFEKILYLPGNHDHHLWEQTRENAFVDALDGDDGDLPSYFHTLSLKDESVTSRLLNALAEMCADGEPIPIEVRYPLANLSFCNEERSFFIHHGHLHENGYLLMSHMLDYIFDHPLSSKLEELEEENFAWIDFFWSTLGRSGRVGEKVEHIYESLSRKESLNKLVEQIAERVAAKEEFLPNWLPREEWLEEKSVKGVLSLLVNWTRQRERENTDKPLSKEGISRLEWFLDDVLPAYLGECYVDKHRDWHTTYIFGHTHKPVDNRSIPTDAFRSIRVFNTGGWVVESGDDLSAVHGAAMTVIGTEGEAGHVHLFSLREEEQGSDYPWFFGDDSVKHVLRDALQGDIVDDFTRKIRRAIAIRRRKPEK